MTTNRAFIIISCLCLGRIRDLQAEASRNAFGTLKFPEVLLQKKLSLRIRYFAEGNSEGENAFRTFGNFQNFGG
jgi:hypothetical protein